MRKRQRKVRKEFIIKPLRAFFIAITSFFYPENNRTIEANYILESLKSVGLLPTCFLNNLEK